jgi:hypothetical protein
VIVKFNDKQLDGGNYLPEGEHEVSVVRCLSERSKAGNEMIVVEMADKFGRQVKEYFLVDEKNLWKLGKFAIAAGFEKETLKTVGLDTALLIGRSVIAIKKQSGVKVVDGKERKEFHVEFFPSSASEAKAEEQLPF